MAWGRLLLCCCILLGWPWAWAAAQPGQDSAEQATETVVAYVNDQPVYLAELDYLIRTTFRRAKIPPAALQKLRSWALETTVRRMLLLDHLRQQGKAVSREELESHLRDFRRRLEANRLSLRQHLAEIGLNEEQFRRAVDWKLSWARFLARELTEEKLRRYFEQHRKDFDGTRLRVAHLLLKAAPEDTQARQRLRRQAEQLRQQIVEGRLSFEEAVARYSQGTRQNGGQLGWIARHGDMPEPFARAAFALEPGQLSPAVETPAGIHLIRVLEVEPGKKTFEQVRTAVRRAAARELFLKLSTPLLEQAQIRTTGRVPWPSRTGSR